MGEGGGRRVGEAMGRSPAEAFAPAWVRYRTEFYLPAPPDSFAFVRFLALFLFLPFLSYTMRARTRISVYIRPICINALGLRETLSRLGLHNNALGLREFLSRLGLHNNALGLREHSSRLGLHNNALSLPVSS